MRVGEPPPARPSGLPRDRDAVLREILEPVVVARHLHQRHPVVVKLAPVRHPHLQYRPPWKGIRPGSTASKWPECSTKRREYSVCWTPPAGQARLRNRVGGVLVVYRRMSGLLMRHLVGRGPAVPSRLSVRFPASLPAARSLRRPPRRSSRSSPSIFSSGSSIRRSSKPAQLDGRLWPAGVPSSSTPASCLGSGPSPAGATTSTSAR